jgi:short-subunit dehydrogenase
MKGKQTALISGASGGIGYELAKVMAQHGHDLVVVARSEDKLRKMAQAFEQQYTIQVQVIARDLTEPSAPDAIFAELQSANKTVDMLVNNAGFASYGLFHELDRSKELNMMQLNMVALVHLTHLFLTGMVARGNGRILNVASTAAFQPGPLMAVYYASKAFVLSFSEAIANELEGTGVSVTALCPGPTESGFQARAAMEESKLVQNGLMDAETVAKMGYEAMMKGKTVEVPGFTNKVGALMPRFVPRKMITKVVRNIQERSGAH